MPTREFRPIQLLHPRHWLLWLGIGVAWLLTLNGARSRRILGPGLANLMRITIPRRVHIARVNLNRCFPKLNPLAQRQLLDATLKSTAQGLLETAATWLHPKQLKHTPMRYKGLEHLDIGPKDNGILILGMHLSTLDLAGAALAQKVPFNVMYKRNRNPVFEWLMRRGRGHYFAESIEQTNVRGVIRNLKAGQRVFDVRLGGKSVLEEFDVVATTGVRRKAIVREFKKVSATTELTIDLVARTGIPILNGVEIVAEE